MPEGRNSPEPERQTGAQVHDVMGSGQTSSDHDANKHSEQSGSSTGNLTSNPKGPLEDVVKEKFDGKLRE
ncbi:hypothetical protein CMQ_7636 [Grosmannia clavigera kw1407]|uniref:Uncharacterized protein n=1 Tax=Grosmannia clavigera (strain kw1407 / UAMH 11150) TaxID=655863 RepID=F0XQI7_GROCL|nr:uncharacterized protein CMQ_7636 [Grosmannia clavigera kw1407]EFX00634.1 hypothetical protein CMQ_7636 [Grosmannia clavigera kw1407]